MDPANPPGGSESSEDAKGFTEVVKGSMEGVKVIRDEEKKIAESTVGAIRSEQLTEGVKVVRSEQVTEGEEDIRLEQIKEGEKVIRSEKTTEGEKVIRSEQITEGVKVNRMVREDQSWISIAEDKKQLKKHDVAVTMKDGKHLVEIPDAILENPTHLWEDFVVGKFLDQAPHVAKVHMVLNKIWKYGDETAKVEVYEVNPTTMRFKVPNPKTREKIIRRGMWNVVGVPMIVSKWTPKSEEEKQEEESIPMWVHLEKVPLNMFSWEALSFITSTVGSPVKLHPETSSCSNLEVAKVFVKVDVSKVLPREITFSKGGSEFTVQYYYPWLPSRCKCCEKWGHNESVCKIKKRGEGMGQSREKERKEMEVVREEKSIRDGIEKETDAEFFKKGSDIGKERVTREEGNSWSLISPAKAGRTQTPTLVKSAEILISASKFSVLEEEEVEEGELVEVGDKLMEEELKEDEERNESALLEESIFDQQEKDKEKTGMKKGLKRGRKPKTQNQKSIRVSQRNH